MEPVSAANILVVNNSDVLNNSEMMSLSIARLICIALSISKFCKIAVPLYG